jgi:RNA polymerase sigma-70 factor (ECF subfamily)
MAPAPHPITELLARVAAGDRDAFGRLYDATSAKLYGIVLRILRRRDIADEVLQEVYVKIWERARDFDAGRASPISWMATIARNRALDEARRRRPSSIEDTPEALDVAADEPHPLVGLELAQDLRRLRVCLEKLEPLRRELVLEAYLHGASREELSKRHGHPVATIKTWLHRSLAQLRSCLAP